MIKRVIRIHCHLRWFRDRFDMLIIWVYLGKKLKLKGLDGISYIYTVDQTRSQSSGLQVAVTRRQRQQFHRHF